MPFSPITAQTKQYVQSGDGRYMLSSISFGAPLDYFKISAGTRNSKSQVVSAAISRVRQKDVTIGTETTRNTLSVQLVIQAPPGFTSAEIDSLVADMNEFITSQTLDRILVGEA